MTLFPESLPPAERPYPVPENWVWVKLGQIVQINPPKPKPNISDEELCSFVPMSAVSEISGTIHAIEEQPFQKMKNGYTGFQEHDVLFAKITPCMENGKAAIAKNLKNGFGYGSTEFFVLRCSHSILNQYIYYFVRSRAFRDEAKPNMTGSVGQKRVPKHFLSNYHFPLPPLPEQRRIAAKLDALLGKLTAAWRAEHPKANALPCIECDEQPYEIPNTWRWVTFKEIAHVKTNLVNPADYPSVVHIAPDNIEKFTGTLLNYQTVEEDGVKSQNHYFYKGQILYSKIRPYLSKVIIADCDGLCSADMYPIATTLEYPYLFRYMLSKVFLEYASNAGSRTLLPKINQQELGRIPVPVAPFEEQREIVRQLESLLGHETDAAGLLDMDDELDLLEQSILSRAFRGELGTNDPAESPAL